MRRQAKNKELEKFKFVLDYKLRELKKEIEPRDEQIVQAPNTTPTTTTTLPLSPLPP